MNKMKIQVIDTGAPYPKECWWRIVGSNGRIIVNSETMGLKNAKRMIERVIEAIKDERFVIQGLTEAIEKRRRRYLKK